MTELIRIKLPVSNAYLLRGERPVLIDTGQPGDTDRLVAALDDHGVAPRDLALIIHTHVHNDHAGASADLARMSGVPTLVGRADAPNATEGDAPLVKFTRLSSRMMFPFVWKPFAAFTPDVIVDGETSLAAYGVDARVIPTPGHTPGSLTILTGAGDAVVGDVLMGGHLGGAMQPTLPRYHYYYTDWNALQRSIAALLATDAPRWHVGHGGPLAVADVRARFGTRSRGATI